MWAHVGNWLWFVVVFVLGVLATKLKDSLKKLYDHLERKLLDWLVGRGLFTRKALRNYMQRLYDDNRQFIVSFQPGSSSEPMDMLKVYVKLSLAVGGGRGGRKQPASLTDARRAVVLGAPGAGKTMLLRHTALAWVHHRYPTDAPDRRTWYGRRRQPRADLGNLTDIPIVIALSKVNPDQELRQHIVDLLATLDFRNAGPWLDRMLDDGRLALHSAVIPGGLIGWLLWCCSRSWPDGSSSISVMFSLIRTN